MTKKELIEALEPYHDDAEIVVDDWAIRDKEYEPANIRYDEELKKLVIY